jgi:hypothetical protein
MATMLPGSVPQGESGAPLHLPFLDHIPFRVTILPRKQVGESASPRLDARDRMADGAKRIKVIGAVKSMINGAAPAIGLLSKGSPVMARTLCRLPNSRISRWASNVVRTPGSGVPVPYA